VAWSCRGGGQGALDLFIDAYQPDVAVVRGWADGRPLLPPGGSSLVFGQSRGSGMLVIGLRGHTVEPARVAAAPWPTVGAVDVTGPHPIRLVAVRALLKPEPPEHPVAAALVAWSEWLTGPGAPLVVAGDLNTDAAWPGDTERTDHETVVHALAGLGMVSAYHHARSQEDRVSGPGIRLLAGRGDDEDRRYHRHHVYAAASAVQEVTTRDDFDMYPLVVDLEWRSMTGLHDELQASTLAGSERGAQPATGCGSASTAARICATVPNGLTWGSPPPDE
jgi:hypothetical protein